MIESLDKEKFDFMKHFFRLFKYIGLAGGILHLVGSAASAQTLGWAAALGSSPAVDSWSQQVDAAGNVYIIGSFTGTLDMDPGPGTFWLSAATPGRVGVFLAKLDADGNLLWAKQFTGGSSMHFSLAIDNQANLYLTGLYDGQVDFDPGPGVFTLGTTPGWKPFLTKLNAEGQLVWAKSFEPSGADAISPALRWLIAIDSQSNLYIAGTCSGSMDFAPGSGLFVHHASYGQGDVFLLKLNSSGQPLWLLSIAGSLEAWPNSLRTDLYGNVYLTGYFQDTLDFAPGSGLIEGALVSQGGSDAFLAKWDTDGQLAWSKQFGGALWDAGVDLSIGAQGDIFLTGYFQDTAWFGPLMLVAAGPQDAFLLRLNPVGELKWGQQLGGTGRDAGLVLASDDHGSLYWAGVFSGQLHLPLPTGPAALLARGGSDIFLSRFTQDGEYQWGLSAGSTKDDHPHGLALDAAGRLYAFGYFQDTLIFELEPFPHILADLTGAQRFICQFSSHCISSSEHLVVEACGPYSLNGQAYASSGVYQQLLTNQQGCDSVLTLELLISPLIAEIELLQLPSCQDAANGQALVSVSGGILPLSFSWSNGEQGELANQLVVGGHTVTITDARGCQANVGTVLDSSSVLSLSLVVLQGLDCHGDSTASVVMSVKGGILPYEFSWAHGPEQASLAALPAGNYVALVKDAAGCMATADISIAEPPVLGLALSTEPAACMEAADGLAIAQPQGGTPPYAYSWSDGQQSQLAAGLAPGIYAVTITDAKGCHRSGNIAVAASAYEPDLAIALLSDTLVVGQPGAEYQWIDCEDGQALPGAQAQFFVPESGGSYAVAVSQGGCSAVSDCFFIEGVSSQANEQAVPVAQLFPNPNEGRFVLVLPWVADAAWYDARGRLLRLDHYTPGAHLLDQSAWPAGVYTLLLGHQQGVQPMRWLKVGAGN
jgi:hypothetical protein